MDVTWVAAADQVSAAAFGERVAARMSRISGSTWRVHSVARVDTVPGTGDGEWEIRVFEKELDDLI